MPLRYISKARTSYHFRKFRMRVSPDDYKIIPRKTSILVVGILFLSWGLLLLLPFPIAKICRLFFTSTIAVFCIRYSLLIIKSKRYPPLKTWTMENTKVYEGKKASSLGWLLLILCCVLLLVVGLHLVLRYLIHTELPMIF